MRPGRLIRLAVQLAEALGEGSALAGGLAVAAWGEIRATRDVDFATTSSLSDVESSLRGAGFEFSVRMGDPLALDLPWVLEGERDGARFQVFSPRGGRSFRTVRVTPAGGSPAIPVVALHDLIRLKVEAGGGKDLLDVASLVRLHPEQSETARALAREAGLGDELERWMTRR